MEITRKIGSRFFRLMAYTGTNFMAYHGLVVYHDVLQGDSEVGAVIRVGRKQCKVELSSNFKYPILRDGLRWFIHLSR